MKVISFSLFGDNPIYTIGAIRNADLKNEIFPDWEMWLYHNHTVPQNILNELEQRGVKLINMGRDQRFLNALWRFIPAGDDTVEYFFSRDCDSRISYRDKEAVEEWIKSGKKAHILRDHPIGHFWVMNAGMWGCKGGSIPAFKEIFDSFNNSNLNLNDRYLDQIFLRDHIYPLIVNDSLIHDEYYKFESFCTPIKRDRALDNFAFIGESIDENDTPRGDQRSCIIEKYRYGN